MAELQFDESRFPLVVLRCPTAFDVRGAEALQSGLERLFARRQKFVLVCDIRPVSRVPDAVVRKRLADVMNLPQVREGQAQYQLGSANVVDSAPLRAALTALLWLWTPPTPMATFAGTDEAVRWSIERLRAAGVEIPASLRELEAPVRRAAR
ncbi:hypothetical protein [Sandaracinus amylolyticus]|uniref:STAS/SEC14 domain-containing protein n=1 Tax=Sandaracinus amylolyticus TaxID=927083 RepID=A0A0F6YKL4_9BACT|nr:hypothetical protein [Sandaracinus amylolyticus]AKF07426.1 hypothetical protein DB32_004575 [Sandaracinus amylolyticus]